MFYEIWHWFTGWVIGWGGIGTLVSVLAWAAWFFCPTVPWLDKILPYKQQLLHIAIGATIFTVCQTYFDAHGYNRGFAVAMSAVAAQNKESEGYAKRASDAVQSCYDSGGDWSVAANSCLR